MDTDRNGSQTARAIMQVAGLMLAATLSGCEQSPAAAQNTHDVQDAQERRMQGAHTADDVRAEQDRAARISDEAVRKISGNTVNQGVAQQPPPLPEGAPLSADGLEAGIVRLAVALQGPEQTEPDFVSRALAVELLPDGGGKGIGAQGDIGTGRYAIEVWTLHDDEPGRHVSIRAIPSSPGDCLLDFARLSRQLEKAGYKGQQAPRFMKPSITFSKRLQGEKAFVRLDLDDHDAPRCVRHVAFDLEDNLDD